MHRSWLTGFQFLETLFIFVRSTESFLILTSAKKAEHLQQIKPIKQLRIFTRDRSSSCSKQLSEIEAVIKEATGKEDNVRTI